MKRNLFFCLLLLILFSGCSSGTRKQSDKINIVCTIFPQYDWVREIIGEGNENFELTLLMDGLDLHSYSPSVRDVAAISSADVFIYVGGGSDGWVEAVLAQTVNEEIIAVNLMEILGIKSNHEHGETCEEDHGQDEHIWLSLRNARVICAALAEIFSEIDPDNSQKYLSNLEMYTAELHALEFQYQSVVSEANIETLVFADRFPFRHLADDCGLEYYAAFTGCSAETQAGFSTIISLADRINQLGLSAVMVTESSDQSFARTVINNTACQSQKILVLDSMQSVTL
ncbi:MAG: metal ABC transporter substrate-binding protein, partial [Clostridiales bacterium]|nr:metal ABC transporter substrate-binding protein [Clostridiales bacterium]